MTDLNTSMEAPATEPPADAASLLDGGSVIGDANPEGAPAADQKAAGDAKPDGEGDKPDGDKPVPLAAGAPEAYALKMPEGVPLDEGAWKLAEPVFREANIGPEQAQKLAEAFPGIAEGIVKRAQDQVVGDVAAIRKAWAAEVKADPEMGGGAYEQNLTLVAKARDTLLTPDDVKFLNDTGLGNSPMMFRLLLRVGKGMAEGTVEGAAPKPAAKSAAEKRYGEGWGPQPAS